MRILYLNHNVAGTGTYQRAFNFAAELVAAGHEVTLVTTSRTLRGGGAEREQRGVRVIEAPDLLFAGARNGWDPWNSGWRMARLRRERFDLIHAFDCRPVVIGPALVQQRRTGAALFLDWADWWGRGGTIGERSGWAVRTLFGPIETWFEEAFRRDAAANTTISEPLRERCIALGVAPERVRALPNGCRPPAVAGSRRSAREQIGAGDAPLIVHLGVAQQKDADLLFDAFRLVRRHRADARLALLGGFRGRVPGDLQGVQRTGYLSDDALAAWLAAADVAVVPMRSTLANRARWPGKVNEYLSAGVPVVMPAVGAAAELVTAAGAGLTSEPEPAPFADAIAHVLREPAARARMSEAGRGLARETLSWQRIGADLLDFYEQWVPRDTAAPVVKGAVKAAWQ